MKKEYKNCAQNTGHARIQDTDNAMATTIKNAHNGPHRCTSVNDLSLDRSCFIFIYLKKKHIIISFYCYIHIYVYEIKQFISGCMIQSYTHGGINLLFYLIKPNFVLYVAD